jgi:hypothetical protein
MSLGAASAWIVTVTVGLIVGSVAVAPATDVAAISRSESATAPSASPALLVRFRNGLLSVRSDGARLADVLEAIVAETGVQLGGEPADRRHVWKRFADVPLAEGLRRVVGRQNFTLTYGDDGTPLRVELLGTPRSVSVPEQKAVAKPPSFFTLLQREPPVLVSARVAAALGTARTIRLAQLARALRVDDPSVRREAVDAFLAALRRNAALRSAFVALPDNQVAALARGWAGGRAEEVLHALATRALYNDVRALARRAAGHVAR